jgi:hypothetical protein
MTRKRRNNNKDKEKRLEKRGRLKIAKQGRRKMENGK